MEPNNFGSPEGLCLTHSRSTGALADRTPPGREAGTTGAGNRQLTGYRHACVLGAARHGLRGTADVEVSLDLPERCPVEILDLNLKAIRPVGLVPRYSHHDSDADVADRRLPVGLLRQRSSIWAFSTKVTPVDPLSDALISSP
jgi:hypothetical protein